MEQYVIPAAAMVLVAIIEAMAARERRNAKKEREEEAEQRKDQEDLIVLLIQGNWAAIALGEATARAVQRIPDAHCNGDMKEALKYATDVKHKLTLYRGLTGADSRAEKFQALMDAGMTWDEVMDAYDRYAELDADEDMKATDKATELARWADENYQEEQAAAIKEQLAFFSIIPAQAERYAALTEAGLDAESAYNLTEIFAGLEPEEGSDTVSNMQRYKAVVTSNLSDQEQLSALGTLMGESEYAKVETGFEFGVTPAMYVQARENVAEIDENGSTSQDEATRAISSIQGLTARERAVLWQLQNKSWKATNNPYDTATGQQVYNALHAGDETETIELPRLGQETEETELPTISLPRLG